MHPLKKSVIIQIPYYQIETEHNEINVKGKWSDENEWVDVGFLKKARKKNRFQSLDVHFFYKMSFRWNRLWIAKMFITNQSTHHMYQKCVRYGKTKLNKKFPSD